MEPLFDNAKILAPLVGGSDLSYRLLARKYGADVTFTEMCIAEYYLERHTKVVKDYVFEFDKSDRPLIAQLGGNSADPIIALANSDIFKGNIDGIDLNCGCPQGFALDKGYGCAMLKDPVKLADICRQVAQAISYPLSVKMRLHDDVPTTIGIIDKLVNVGVRAITVHGRYWWQKGESRGKADWNAVREIKSKFPQLTVIGNGDICKYEDFNNFQSESGVDATMAGYGALLNPSIFSSEGPDTLSNMITNYVDIARGHINDLIDVQRHIGWIVKKAAPPDFKARLFDCGSLVEIRDLLATLPKPVHLDLKDPVGGDLIKLPWSTSVENMTSSEKRKLKHRAKKRKERMERKTAKAENAEVTEDVLFSDIGFLAEDADV